MTVKEYKSALNARHGCDPCPTPCSMPYPQCRMQLQSLSSLSLNISSKAEPFTSQGSPLFHCQITLITRKSLLMFNPNQFPCHFHQWVQAQPSGATENKWTKKSRKAVETQAIYDFAYTHCLWNGSLVCAAFTLYPDICRSFLAAKYHYSATDPLLITKGKSF